MAGADDLSEAKDALTQLLADFEQLNADAEAAEPGDQQSKAAIAARRSALAERLATLEAQVPEATADLDRRMKKAQSYARWLRECSSALVAGGGAVAVGLMLGGLPIQPEVSAALLVIYATLVVAAGVSSWRVGRTLRGESPAGSLLGVVWPAVLIAEVGVMGAARGQWPVKPYTLPWWNFVALALLVGASGLWRRHKAETMLRILDES